MGDVGTGSCHLSKVSSGKSLIVFYLEAVILGTSYIYTCRQEGDEYKLKLADVNLALGEVSLESGNGDCLPPSC